MHCARCHHPATKVVDSREAEENRTIRRRRECEKCAYRFTTYERVNNPAFIVVKKSGEREPYDHTKLEAGIWRACEKRPITQAQVDQLIEGLEEKWALSKRKEIKSRKLGEDVMNALKALDSVAYIRFASVYHAFADPSGFIQALDQLEQVAAKTK